jgi:hypothetical protein
MTMIAFRIGKDRAEVMTDSLVYTDGSSDTRQNYSKVAVLSHLEMAVVAQGPIELAHVWRLHLATIPDLTSMDDVDEWAQLLLPRIWQELDLPGDDWEACVFHVGWSPRRQRYVAHAYSSLDGFALTDLTEHEFFCQPVPMHAAVVPQTDEDWIELAAATFQHHMLAPHWTRMQTPIGGDVQFTTLLRGASIQRRLGSLPGDPSHPVFRKALIGTMHKWGQLGPCYCLSGKRFFECHLPQMAEYTADCPCGSGVPFHSCHLVDANGDDAQGGACPAAVDRRRRADCR